MSDKYAVNEDYWETIGDDRDDQEDDVDVPDTVLDRIVDQLDPDRIHGIEFHGSNGRAYYGVVAYSGQMNGMDVIHLQTVIVDLRDEVVKLKEGNGLWIPRFEGAAGALTSIVARASSEIDGSLEADGAPLLTSAINTEAESILSHEMEDDYKRESGHGWGKTWGNGQGEPPAVHDFVTRLEQADVPTSRFCRLNFGEKSPHERYTNRSPDGLMGNYGVEIGVPGTTEEAGVDDRVLENDPLIVVDVDYPDEAPLEEIPETLAVSSASGDDDRAHHYFRVTDKRAVYDHFGSWAVKPSWGDVWLAGEYVVGPGCVTGDGEYNVTTDVPIATLTADETIELLEDEADDPDEADEVLEEINAGHPEPEPTETLEPEIEEHVDERDDQEDDEKYHCDDCGATVDPGTATLSFRDGETVYLCSGGECDD